MAVAHVMRSRIALLILMFLSLAVERGNGQGSERNADEYLFDKNYMAALDELKLLLRSEPENVKYNFNIGVCYLNTHFEKIKAVPYLQKVIFYDEYAAEAYYFLGKAYQYNHEFDRAIDNFNMYLKNYDNSEISKAEARREIEYCENAFQLIRRPLKVNYENLGSSINSSYPDFFPFVPLDESFLVYTSRRDDGSKLQKNGQYTSNIYYSPVEEGNYKPSAPMEGVNSDNTNESVVGLSGDGSTILLYLEKAKGEGSLWSADLEDGVITNKKVVDPSIVSKNREIAASISTDGNIIYYTAERKGGLGGSDIWVTRILPTGNWGIPQNLGSSINTEFDDDFPNISPDGKTLYFSSKGHFSMGGYDIFKAEFDADSNAFTNPRNMGYPINSVSDDMNYRLSRSGRFGYLSCIRKEGEGDLDMYRITIEEVEPDFSVLNGEIKSEDGSPVDFLEITVVDDLTGELVGIYAPNPRSMRYVIIVPPGKYEVNVEADGFEPQQYKVDILGKGSFRSEISEDVILKPER